MKNTYLLSIIALFFAACGTTENSQDQAEVSTSEMEQSTTLDHLPTSLSNGIKSHGGIKTWDAFNSVSYELENMTNGNKQQHIVDLYTRKVRITDSLYTLGYDGDQVWVSPDLATFGGSSPRFYHNLYFYFFAIPYVLADPGINYEDLGQQTINDVTYNAVKISYDQGIGDTPEDYYIAHFNPETGLMELLLYTVTYFSKASHEKYNALLYKWQDVNGIQVAKSIKGYKYDSTGLGDLRYESSFNNVMFSKEKPDGSLFSIPDVAQIDSVNFD